MTVFLSPHYHSLSLVQLLHHIRRIHFLDIYFQHWLWMFDWKLWSLLSSTVAQQHTVSRAETNVSRRARSGGLEFLEAQGPPLSRQNPLSQRFGLHGTMKLKKIMSKQGVNGAKVCRTEFLILCLKTLLCFCKQTFGKGQFLKCHSNLFVEIKSFRKTFSCEMESPFGRKACLLFASDSSGQLLTDKPGTSFAICLREWVRYTLGTKDSGTQVCPKMPLRGEMHFSIEAVGEASLPRGSFGP